MIENPGNIGHFIGGVGVFVTLLYLVTNHWQVIHQHKNGFFDQHLENNPI